MRKTKDEAELTRQKLLRAGYELILDKGYERMTRDDIARKVGMTRGAVNWHFKTKEDIYIAILTDFLDDLAQIRQSIYTDRSQPVEQRLKALYLVPIQAWDKFNFINQIPRYLLKQAPFQAVQQRMYGNRLEFMEYLHTCLNELEAERDKPFTINKANIVAMLYFLYEGLHSSNSETLFGDDLNEESVAQYLGVVLSKLE